MSCVLFTLAAPLPALAAPDIVLADFEGADYGAWKAEGKAFGSGPARWR
jgi:fructan beta-fructosidase